MNRPMAAILVIGNEILSGRVEDANVGYIARRLTDLGIPLKEVRVVADVEADIVAAVNALRERFTYVFTTGGIGPTHDDITLLSMSKAFGVGMVRNPRVEEHLRGERGNTITDAALKMADYPEGAEPVWHGESWAPGCRVGNVFMLAGIPRVMQVMFEAAVPLLAQGAPIHSRSVDVLGRESELAEGLSDIQAQFAALEVGSYPFRHENQPGSSLVVRGTDLVLVDKAFAAMQAMVKGLGLVVRG